MYMNDAECHSILLLLGQEGEGLPPHWNLPVEPSQSVTCLNKILLKRMNLIKKFEISHEEIFDVNLPTVLRLCVWCEFCAPFLRWLRRQYHCYTCFLITDNLLPLIGVQQQSEWTYFNQSPELHRHDTGPDQSKDPCFMTRISSLQCLHKSQC